jgi:uncharacterized protein (DUF305 family)
MTDHSAHHAVAPDSGASAFEADMTLGMARMMQDMHSPGYTGRPDADFLAMMIPHHEGAVDMARLVLIHGRDPMVRQIAEEIIASQTVAILRLVPCGAVAEATGIDSPARDALKQPTRQAHHMAVKLQLQ